MAHELRAAVHLHGADAEPFRGLAQERLGGVRRGARAYPGLLAGGALPPGGRAAQRDRAVPGGDALPDGRKSLNVLRRCASSCGRTAPDVPVARLRGGPPFADRARLRPPHLHRPLQDAPHRRLARRALRTPLGQLRRDARLPRPRHLPPKPPAPASRPPHWPCRAIPLSVWCPSRRGW